MPLFPTLFQVNARLWLAERDQPLQSLADLPEDELDSLAQSGFDWLYLLGVWQTGPVGRQVSLAQTAWHAEYDHLLPGWTAADVCGSPFAIQAYRVHADFGGDAALAHLRRRLAERGIKLLLDFVPNHTAPDHPWVRESPQFYMPGDENDMIREPQNFQRVDSLHGPRVLAHGRDPYFPGWPDTLQLNYRHPGLRQAMSAELLRIATQCDGVRCDMAMLLLPDVIARTWGERSRPPNGQTPADVSFWPEAISRVRRQAPGFVFMAEVYWDLEWTLQQQGFDYTYDKRLYDRLRQQDAEAVRGHLWADADYQRRSVRFLENHDEPRAAAVFPAEAQPAAALAAHCVPGLRFFHDGEREGRKLRASVHLGRRARETPDLARVALYDQLLQWLRRPELRDGQWQLLGCNSAWPGNASARQFLAYAWTHDTRRLLIVINYAPQRGQCRVDVPFADLAGKTCRLTDLVTGTVYERSGDELAGRGLFVDLPAWGRHVFAFD